MMHLVSIHLKNFQIHRDLPLEFSKGITTIIGPTDQGKSSVLRALKWICLNDLPGEEFIKEGEKKTEVSLRIQNAKMGSCLVRLKGKGGSLNTYNVNGKEFKSFATSVPADAANLLQLNEINFQSQHDAPFWFSETPGEVSRQLNSVIDLSIIDATLSNIAAAVRTAQERKALINERHQTAKDELEKIQPSQVRIEEFERLRRLEAKVSSLSLDFHRLEEFVGRVNSDQSKELLAKSRDGEELVELGGKVLRYQGQAARLSSIIENARTAKKESVPPPDFDKVIDAFILWKRIYEKMDDLIDLIQDLLGLKERCKEKVVKQEIAERQFALKTKNAVCPLCLHPL